MGGCINAPKSKIIKPENDEKIIKKPVKQAYEERPAVVVEPARPRYKRITSEQFLVQYTIETNVEGAARAEGPKYISNSVDGSGKVLRVLQFQSYNEKRLHIYKEILNLEVYEDEEGNLLVLDEYCCGKHVGEVATTDSNSLTDFLTQVHTIISSFHQKGIYLGNLNIFSFRFVSKYERRVRLIDFNWNDNCEESMGHAHKQGRKQVDWEVFGYMLQYVVMKEPPIFIPHKIQYIEIEHQCINDLLRGKQPKAQQFLSLPFHSPPFHITAGYMLRHHLQQLLKIRKRRQNHRSCYYPKDFFENGKKLSEESIQRIQTMRVIDKIEEYIEDIESGSQEAFLEYMDGGDKFRKFKEVFVMREPVARMREFKDVLPMIR